MIPESSIECQVGATWRDPRGRRWRIVERTETGGTEKWRYRMERA